MSTALITGGAGFVGTNTADRLLRDGWRVRVLDDLSRTGVAANLGWLEATHGSALEVVIADVRQPARVARAIRGIDHVFHFAAQVAVTTSFDAPLCDAGVNLQGTLNVLDACRGRAHPPSIVFTSTNKVYGALPELALDERGRRYDPREPDIRTGGIDETRPLRFCTPYGCSKGAADQYVVDWASSYGVPTVVFRMSCIYGPHQFGTEDQGWVAHFLISALQDRPITIYGSGKQVRDVLFIDDLVDALVLAAKGSRRLSGRAFNIGGGPANAVSLLELLDMIGELCGPPRVVRAPWRAGDQRYYVSDTSAFSRATGWTARTDPRIGLDVLHAWLIDERSSLAITS
ncbi:MAG: NAD-dependent epimerase/dehydratase family protein [Solirubrobacterales bacterium]|nr:NAD-dependent epimerase/dehydratase family protein [Solirubrobacterales bacterium]